MPARPRFLATVISLGILAAFLFAGLVSRIRIEHEVSPSLKSHDSSASPREQTLRNSVRHELSASVYHDALFCGRRLQQYAVVNGLPEWYQHHTVLIGNCDSDDSDNLSTWPRCLAAIMASWDQDLHGSLQRQSPHVGQFPCYLLLSGATDADIQRASDRRWNRTKIFNATQDAAVIDGDVSWLLAAIIVGGENVGSVRNKFGETIKIDDILAHLAKNSSPFCFGQHRRLALALAVRHGVATRASNIGKDTINELSLAAKEKIPRMKDVKGLVTILEPKLAKASQAEIQAATLQYLGHELHWRAVFDDHCDDDGEFENAAKDCLEVVVAFVEDLYDSSDQRGLITGKHRQMFGAACHAVAAITAFVR